MKITSINLPKINNFKYSQKTNRIKQSQIKDSFCFSGKNSVNNDNTSNNIKKAVEFFDKLINLPKEKEIKQEDLQRIVQEYTPDVTVLPMNALKENMPNADFYGAFFSSHMNPDFTMTEQKLYIDPIKGRGNVERFAFACDSAHEFTHAMQIQKGKSIEQLKELANGDYNYAKFIMGFGDTLFSFFDNQLQAQATLPTFYNLQDSVNIQRYGTIIPRPATISENSIYQGLKLNSEKEFNEQMNAVFEALFYRIFAENQAKPEFLNSIPKTENLEQIKRKIKKYCAIKARDEKEAYTTEVKAGKKLLNTNKSLNIEIRPIYYEKLEKLFSK